MATAVSDSSWQDGQELATVLNERSIGMSLLTPDNKGGYRVTQYGVKDCIHNTVLILENSHFENVIIGSGPTIKINHVDEGQTVEISAAMLSSASNSFGGVSNPWGNGQSAHKDDVQINKFEKGILVLKCILSHLLEIYLDWGGHNLKTNSLKRYFLQIKFTRLKHASLRSTMTKS